MSDILTYKIGPSAAASAAVASVEDTARPWLAISGPSRRQSSEMAERIAFLETRLAALEARYASPFERVSGLMAAGY